MCSGRGPGFEGGESLVEINLLAPRHRRPPVKQVGLLVLLLAGAVVMLITSWATIARGRNMAFTRQLMEAQVQRERALRAQAAPDSTDQQLLTQYAALAATRPDFPKLLEVAATTLPAAGRLDHIRFAAPGTLTVSGYLPSLQSVAGYMQLLEETGLFASVTNPVAANTGQEVQFSLELQLAGAGGHTNEAE